MGRRARSTTAAITAGPTTSPPGTVAKAGSNALTPKTSTPQKPKEICNCKPNAQKYILGLGDGQTALEKGQFLLTSKPHGEARSSSGKCVLCITGALQLASVEQHFVGEESNPIKQSRMRSAPVTALIEAADVNSDTPSASTVRAIDARFWNALVRFVVVERSEEDMRTLLQRLDSGDTVDLEYEGGEGATVLNRRRGEDGEGEGSEQLQCLCTHACASDEARPGLRTVAERNLVAEYRARGMLTLRARGETCGVEVDRRGIFVCVGGCSEPDEEVDFSRAHPERFMIRTRTRTGVLARQRLELDCEPFPHCQHQHQHQNLTRPQLKRGTIGLGKAFILCAMHTICCLIGRTSLRATAKGRARSWPYAPTDLIPFGAPSYVRAMGMWARVLQVGGAVLAGGVHRDVATANIETTDLNLDLATTPLTLMSLTFRMCGSLLGPSIVEARFTEETALEMGRGIVKRAMEGLAAFSLSSSSLDVNRMSTSLDPTRSIRDHTALAHVTQIHLRAMFYYLHTSIMDQPALWRRRLFAHCEWKTVQLCSMLAYLCSDHRWGVGVHDQENIGEFWGGGKGGKLDWAGMVRETAFMGRFVVDNFMRDEGMLLPSESSRVMKVFPAIADDAQDNGSACGGHDEDHPPPPSSMSCTSNGMEILTVSEKIPSQLHMEVAKLLIALRATTYCSVVGCNESIHSAGRAFRRCEGCGLAVYCGKDCQAKAWKGDEVIVDELDESTRSPPAHKVVCGILVGLLASGGGVAKLKEFFGNGDAPATHPEILESACTRARIRRIVSRWEDVGVDVSDEEFMMIRDWCCLVLFETHHVGGQSTKEVDAGWADYEAIVEQLVVFGRGPEPVSLDLRKL